MRGAAVEVALGEHFPLHGWDWFEGGFIHEGFDLFISAIDIIKLKQMAHYSIHFSLLLPRFRLMRLDIFPFLVIYAVLAYFLYEHYEDPILNLYLRLTIIAACFLQSLTYIFGHWSKKSQSVIQFRSLSGSMAQNLENASHVLIEQKREGEKTIYGISDLYKQELQNGKSLYIFHFQQRKFFFDRTRNTFMRLKPKLESNEIHNILFDSVQKKDQQQFYDHNILQIPIRPFESIFRDQIIDPFAFFQIFSVFLWMMDDNRMFSIMILVMLVGTAYTMSVQRIKTLVGYRSMTLAPHQTHVLEGGKWTIKSSYELLPGDIVAIQPGYQHKKSEYDMMSDSEYLAQAIPFSSKMPSKLMASNNKEEENHSYKNVSCDILILSGTCVVNEAILTGEAIPQIKESIASSDLNKKFHENHYKSNMLFCGTEILQINDDYHEDQLNDTMKLASNSKVTSIPRPPLNRCCIGVVLKTGFDTSKGKLIRRVVAHAENPSIQQKDGLWIILFLLICSLFTSAYVLDQGMDNQQRSKEKLFLRCILILTTVVPPQLPMILNLAVNNSILFLQKKKIFISEPKKIPLGGRVNVVAFDKTGTLTEDKFIFEGVVDDCNKYQELKTFKNCTNQNLVVLAGCHSLISVEKQLSGDPIELMFFQLSKWDYTSKSKEAKKGLERVIIQKVFPFKSQLKRMSTIAEHISENGVRKMKVLVKGAPQALQKLLKAVPVHYRPAYSYYTKQGYRLLALASKEISHDFSKDIKNKDQEREMAERDLDFVGFFICSSPLKEDTKKQIESLQKAEYKILIITGDNILTAAKVGLSLDLGKTVWLLEKQGDKAVLEYENGERHEITGLKQLKHKAETHPQAIIATSTAKDLPHDYYQHISIFARASPHDKEVIVKFFKEMPNGGILYAGDGTNDVGGLRAADVGVAVVGTTNISEVVKKQDQKKKQSQEYEKRLLNIRNDPGIPLQKKFKMMKDLNQERVRNGFGGMGMGAMVSDDEIKFGDACIAAPFTSKHSNSIKCVLIIIRQAIATLVTTVQTYKILAISSMIQAYSLAEMNLTNLKYSQRQSLVLGVLASINFYFFSNAKPLKKISSVRAPHTIWNIWFGISFFGQIIIFLGVNYYALNYIGLKYLPEEDKNISADVEFQRSFVNTVILLFSAISQSVVFIVNHGGEPHMESLIKNSKILQVPHHPAYHLLRADRQPLPRPQLNDRPEVRQRALRGQPEDASRLRLPDLLDLLPRPILQVRAVQEDRRLVLICTHLSYNLTENSYMSAINSFQAELLEKIQQKSKTRESLDSFLLKAFKFFDLTNNGYLSKRDFFKAVAKCGVVVQPNNIDLVFAHYAEEEGIINYHNFIEQIAYRQEEIESNSSRVKFPQKSRVEAERESVQGSRVQEEKQGAKESRAVKVQPKLQSYDEVLLHIKSTIQKQGMGSLLSLAVKFKSLDSNKSHSINRAALARLLDFLAPEHVSLILGELSENGTEIDYSVFVYDLKGQLNEETIKDIDSLFAYLDTRRQGEFPIDYLLTRYLSKSLDEAFRRAVDLYSRFQGIDDGIFTEDDFNDFLGFLSFDYSSIDDFKKNVIRPFYEQDNKSTVSQRSNRTRDFQMPKSQKELSNHGDFRKDKKEEDPNDDHFKKFNEDFQEDKKSVSRYSQFQGHEVSNNKLKLFESVILRIKKRLASKGTRGFLQLQKALKNADTDHDTLLTIEQFTQVIKDQRIDITQTESNNIFDLFDNEGVGLISFAEFMFTLRGHMSELRKDLSGKLWTQIRNNDDTTSFSKIRHLLNFRSHPDVQTGRRYEEDIWKEIQETILTIQQLNGVARSDVISQVEFEEYLENLSLSVIDDKLFQSILLNFWRLDTSSSILEKYAGSRKVFDQSKNGYLMDHHRNYVKGGSVSQNAPFGTFHEPTSYKTEHQRL